MRLMHAIDITNRIDHKLIRITLFCESSAVNTIEDRVDEQILYVEHALELEVSKFVGDIDTHTDSQIEPLINEVSLCDRLRLMEKSMAG